MTLMCIASFILALGLNNLEGSSGDTMLLRAKGIIQIILSAVMAVVGLFMVFESVTLNI